MQTRADINDSLRDENAALNASEFASGAVALRSLPPVLFVELTQNCNLRCAMCRSGGAYNSELDMSDELFTMLCEELFPSASIVDLRGWGESTILKSLPDRIASTVAAGPRLRLVTNALAVSQELWALLMGVGAIVAVSVDAASTATSRKLRRGSFDKLRQSLEFAARERDANNNRGTFGFNTVLTSHNLDDLDAILHLANDLGVTRVTAFPVVARRTNELHLDHRRGELSHAIGQAGELAKQLGVEFRLGASPHEELVVAEGLPNRCSHPWEYCYIDHAGGVGYCDHIIGNKKLLVGNLRTMSFNEIWNGPDFQQLRASHVAAKRNQPGVLDTSHPHCAWCYRRRYVDFEDETDNKATARVVSSTGLLPMLASAPCPHLAQDFM